MADGSLIALRMRLTGGKEVAAESEAAAKGIAKTGEAAAAANAKTAKSSAKLAKTVTGLKTVGRGLTSYVSLPIAGVAAAAGYMALDFDRSMRNVNSIAQLPEKRFESLKQQVLDLAGPTAQAPKTLSEGLYDLVSSGFDANEAMVVLKASALSASAGLTTTEVSTKATAAVINAYSLKAGDATKVSDTLFETVNRGVLTYEELASTIGDVLPFAAQLGINLNEVGASISTMTKGGLSAPESVTRLKNAMVTLIKPGKALKDRLDEIGLSGEELVKKKGFQGAIEEIIAPLHGNKEAIAALFPNIRSLGGVLSLTGINAKRAAGDLKAFKDTTGATNTVLKEQEKSFGFKLQRAWAKLQAVLIELGEKILPIVVPFLVELAEGAGKLVAWFEKLPTPLQKFVLGVGAVAALAGPMLLFASAVLTAARNVGLLGEAQSAATLSGGKFLGKLGLVGAGVMASQTAGKMVGGTGGNLLSNVGTGAAIGAGVGSIVPGVGTVLGGAVGATAGAALSAFQKLNGAQKALTVTQMRLSRDSKVVASGMREQQVAAGGLIHAENRVQTATARNKTANHNLARARHAVNEAVAEYGAQSHPALAAEHKLAGAINAHRVALHRLQAAEKLRGVVLSEFKQIARTNVLNERNEINVLKSKATHLNNEYTALKKSHASQSELTTAAQKASGANGRLSEATKRMAETISEAATKAGPKFATFLKNGEREALQFGSVLQALEVKAENAMNAFSELGNGPVTGISPTGGVEHGGNAPSAKSTEHGLEIPGLTKSGRDRGLLLPRRRQPAPDPRAAALAQDRGTGGGAPLVHAVFKVDKKVLADATVEGIEDAEARR